MGRHARPSAEPAELVDERSAGWPTAHAGTWESGPVSGSQPAAELRPSPVAPGRGASTAARPSPFPRTATSRPAPVARPLRGADDAVAVAVLPPVPTTGARPALVGTVVERRVAERSEHVVPRRVRRAAERTRKGGRLHGVLVYALGLLLVLSSVYGVARSVGDGENVITDTASSVRSFCFGDDSEEDGRGVQESSDETSPTDGTSVEAGSEVEEATEDEVAEEEVTAEEPAAEAPAVASPAPVATSPSPSVAAPVVAAPRPSGATSSVPAGTWLSGASGDGVADGSFAAWRGSPVTIAGTWVDNNEAMVEVWPLQPGAEFSEWDQALDIAIGAISDEESWAEAAQGAYDARWRESLTNMKTLWGDRTAPLFIRFAHELNGNWYPWSVNAGNREDFVTSWKHFRALQQEIFPAAQLVFSLNRESVGSGFDWRQSFPGAEYVDVIGVDYYNQYPTVTNAAEWAASLDDVDKYGAPKGLQQHLDFARSVGLPLSVPEWSGEAQNADSAAFIQGMHEFFTANAGGGAGQLIYDVQFNIDMHEDQYRVFPSTRMPQSAAMYQKLF